MIHTPKKAPSFPHDFSGNLVCDSNIFFRVHARQYHDFSGNLVCDSNQLFLLKFLDTCLRGYDGIFLRFCTEFDIEKVCQHSERGI